MHFKQNVPSNPLALGSREEVENAKRGVRQVGAGGRWVEMRWEVEAI